MNKLAIFFSATAGLVVALSIFLFLHGAPAGEPAWVAIAGRLNGLSEAAHKQALVDLAARPELDKELLRALDSAHRYLALDVISTLHREALLPEVIRRSETEPTGFMFLTIASFVNNKNLAEISELFHQRLTGGQASAPAKMILLDTLARMRYRLANEELAGYLFRDPSAEVRSSALAFVRHFLVDLHEATYLPLLRHVLGQTDLSYQARLQGLYLFSELSASVQKSLAGEQVRCPKDSPAGLRRLCDLLGRE